MLTCAGESPARRASRVRVLVLPIGEKLRDLGLADRGAVQFGHEHAGPSEVGSQPQAGDLADAGLARKSRLADRVEFALARLDEQCRLAAEVPVHGRRRHLGAAGDVSERRSLVSTLDTRIDGSAQQSVARWDAVGVDLRWSADATRGEVLLGHVEPDPTDPRSRAAESTDRCAVPAVSGGRDRTRSARDPP